MLGRTALTNKLVSKKLGIEEQKVESVVNFVFKELETEMKEMKNPTIYLRGLGTFGISPGSVDRRIIFLLKVIRKQEKAEANGHVYNKRAKMLLGMRREIFRLFEVRRLLKKRKAENKALTNGKNTNDTKGELVSTYRKE